MAKSKHAAQTTSRDILELAGLDHICEQMVGGASQAEIALGLGVLPSDLSAFLNSSDDRIKRSAHARALSAEAWLDRGLHTLKMALPRDGNVDPSAAKAYAQECARRAAIRNPRYVERTAHEHSGPGGAPMQTTAVSAKEFAAIAKKMAREV